MSIRNEANRDSGPQAGDSVVCLICKAVFDNHAMLVKHLFAVHGLGLTDTRQQGFDLDLFPWEDAAAVVAEAEAILSEKECKPGLGVDNEPFDELEFMGATLDALRVGALPPIQVPQTQEEMYADFLV